MVKAHARVREQPPAWKGRSDKRVKVTDANKERKRRGDVSTTRNKKKDPKGEETGPENLIKVLLSKENPLTEGSRGKPPGPPDEDSQSERKLVGFGGFGLTTGGLSVLSWVRLAGVARGTRFVVPGREGFFLY